MKVLIVSAEVWRDDTNGGNVLSNIFRDTGFEFAQIYCNPGVPMNSVCRRYYQITDFMMMKSIYTGHTAGMELEDKDYSPNMARLREMHKGNAEVENKSFYHFFKKHRLETFIVARELIWKFGNMRGEKLKRFVEDFSPDVIFAPCYGSHAMLRLDRYIKSICPRVPMISYVSDDLYSNGQWRFSLIYWLNHFMLRKNVRKTFPQYNLVYTMTDEQLAQCKTEFNASVKILRKSADFDRVPRKERVNEPIKMVYAGGVYLNRWRTLSALAKAITRLNADGVQYRLDVYTGTALKEQQKRAILQSDAIKLHKVVTYAELMNIYRESDIALHVEGFDVKNRLAVRMSFSTKIIDCLMSGCACMAICEPKQAGFAFLKRNKLAICVGNPQKIEYALRIIAENHTLLLKVQNRAVNYGRKNLRDDRNKQMMKEDFDYWARWGKGL